MLVVEDHADTLFMLRRLLEGRGHEVRAAATVHEALECAKQWTFDALLSDIGLSDGDGWHLIEQLRAGREFRAIAMSGCSSRQDHRRSVEAGYECHLVKPFDPDLLHQQLDKIYAQIHPPPAA